MMIILIVINTSLSHIFSIAPSSPISRLARKEKKKNKKHKTKMRHLNKRFRFQLHDTLLVFVSISHSLSLPTIVINYLFIYTKIQQLKLYIHSLSYSPGNPAFQWEGMRRMGKGKGRRGGERFERKENLTLSVLEEEMCLRRWRTWWRRKQKVSFAQHKTNKE